MFECGNDIVCYCVCISIQEAVQVIDSLPACEMSDCKCRGGATGRDKTVERKEGVWLGCGLLEKGVACFGRLGGGLPSVGAELVPYS